MENGGQKRGADRNRELRIEMGYGEKWRITERNGDAGNGSEGRECRRSGRSKERSGLEGKDLMECDGKAWNVMEGLERCRNDVGASEMDLAKFYVTYELSMWNVI